MRSCVSMVRSYRNEGGHSVPFFLNRPNLFSFIGSIGVEGRVCSTPIASPRWNRKCAKRVGRRRPRRAAGQWNKANGVSAKCFSAFLFSVPPRRRPMEYSKWCQREAPFSFQFSAFQLFSSAPFSLSVFSFSAFLFGAFQFSAFQLFSFSAFQLFSSAPFSFSAFQFFSISATPPSSQKQGQKIFQ